MAIVGRNPSNRSNRACKACDLTLPPHTFIISAESWYADLPSVGAAVCFRGSASAIWLKQARRPSACCAALAYAIKL